MIQYPGPSQNAFEGINRVLNNIILYRHPKHKIMAGQDFPYLKVVKNQNNVRN